MSTRAYHATVTPERLTEMAYRICERQGTSANIRAAITDTQLHAAAPGAPDLWPTIEALAVAADQYDREHKS